MTIPVNKVNGIGPKTTEYLKLKKVTTVAALVKFGVANLSLAPGFNTGRATTAINAAKKLISISTASKPTKKTRSENIKSKNKKSDKKNKKNTKDKKDKKSKKEKAKKNKKKDKKKNKK
ncbi:MAG: hypothetical protein DHS20C09_04310 [marine bacterium B5-7]|nr:MAG: hypothetical protein DHS20C09_04310 [marine bacterium B5-7]